MVKLLTFRTKETGWMHWECVSNWFETRATYISVVDSKIVEFH